MKLGCYISLSGKNKLLEAAEKMLEYGANCFMGYTGAPTNTIRSAIDSENVKKADKLLKENGLDLSVLVIHAPYILSLPSNEDAKRLFSREFLVKEIQRTSLMGSKTIVFHAGSFKDNLDAGIKRLAESINWAISETEELSEVKLLLETSSGKGTEIGKNFEEIKRVIDLVSDKNRFGVCLDTCHVFDAGYDIKNDLEGVLQAFEKIIGLEYLKVIHLNDSQNEFNSKRDRHANIGYGKIGFKALLNICYHPKLIEIPKILETPYETIVPYKEEIKMLKEKRFHDFLNKGEKNE